MHSPAEAAAIGSAPESTRRRMAGRGGVPCREVALLAAVHVFPTPPENITPSMSSSAAIGRSIEMLDRMRTGRFVSAATSRSAMLSATFRAARREHVAARQ